MKRSKSSYHRGVNFYPIGMQLMPKCSEFNAQSCDMRRYALYRVPVLVVNVIVYCRSTRHDKFPACENINGNKRLLFIMTFRMFNVAPSMQQQQQQQTKRNRSPSSFSCECRTQTDTFLSASTSYSLSPPPSLPPSLPPLVLPVLLVPAGRDVDGEEAVVHEAESHGASLRPEQLAHDQQVHDGVRRRVE